MSCAKDKRVKVWQLPPIWMDEDKVKNEEKHNSGGYTEETQVFSMGGG
jgi:hypothetical protein